MNHREQAFRPEHQDRDIKLIQKALDKAAADALKQADKEGEKR